MPVTEEELKTIFASSCIESAARAIGCPASEMYLRMKRINLIENYIWEFYDVLHTQSRVYVYKRQTKVDYPIAKAGRENLDFGQGFYITNIREQAERWAFRIGRQLQESPILNIYELDIERIEKEYRYLKFKKYDQQWLEFIVKSRKGEKPWATYDIVEGGVANDRVIDTVEAYINGMMTVEMALGQLAQHQPNNQFCLLSQLLIDECLHFVSIEQLNP